MSCLGHTANWQLSYRTGQPWLSQPPGTQVADQGDPWEGISGRPRGLARRWAEEEGGGGGRGEIVLTQQKVPLKIYQLGSKEAGRGGGAGVGVTMGTWVPLSPGPPGRTLPLPTVVTKPTASDPRFHTAGG